MLEIDKDIIEDRLCCASQNVIGILSKKVGHFDMPALSILLTSYYRDPRSPCNIAMIGKKACSNCWSVE